MKTNTITHQEFRQFQRFIYDAAGVNLPPARKALVVGRLAKQLTRYRTGIDGQKSRLPVDRMLCSRVQFAQVNLHAPLPQLGTFDVIFLRNVRSNFNNETKRQVVSRILSSLWPGRLSIIGYSKILNDVTDAVEGVIPSVYRKPRTC